jgi:hypothetical protein
MKREALIAQKLGRRAAVENGKAHAVEPRQPCVRADPEVAIGGLSQGDHGVARESVLGTPGFQIETGGGQDEGGRGREIPACQQVGGQKHRRGGPESSMVTHDRCGV